MNTKYDNIYNNFFKISIGLILFFIGYFTSESSVNQIQKEYNSKIDSLTTIQKVYEARVDSLQNVKDSTKIIINNNTKTIVSTKLKIDTIWKEYKNVEKSEFDSTITKFITSY